MNDETNNSKATTTKDMQTEPSLYSAPQKDKRSIRIAGLELAGGGAIFSILMVTTKAFTWLHKWASDLPGILGAVGLALCFGLISAGPLMFIIGLSQAVSGYDVEKKWWNK